uniref:PKD domain-containing protein n=1 Tax=Candidatus Methanomethylicus mesodigestus TaxID=1867258 RepID=A0A7C3J1K6_9CREN
MAHLRKICFGLALLSFLIFSSAAAPAAAGRHEEFSREYQISLPMYVVSRQEGYDYVEIPGGGLANEAGKPMVPTFTYTILMQGGERAQSVAIAARGAIINSTGLVLPIFDPYMDEGGTTQHSANGDGDWFPEVELSWETWENRNGTSTISVTFYPFRYNANTTDSSYCQEYALEITYVITSAVIGGISTDKPAYDPGEVVTLEVEVVNLGAPGDYILGIKILRSGTLEVIDALPLRTLHELQGTGSARFNWTTAGARPGEYVALAELNDTAGHWISSEALAIPVGVPKIDLVAFRATPQNFEIGEVVTLDAVARNIGAAGASGACIMMISGDEGTIMAVEMNFTELKAGEEVAFQAFWDTSNATEGAIYQAMAYISCEGTSSLPKSCLISTNRFPIAAISFSPAAAWTGLNVTFDASASYDPDGNIAAFIWEFGDFSSFEGALVTHSYAVPRNYTVTLTVVDEKGAEGRATAKIEVVRGFFLNVSSNIGVPVEGAELYPEGGLARAIAQHEVPVPGVMGRLGAKYVFKHWAGASNSNTEIVDIAVDYEASRSGLVAIYEEQTDMTFYIMLVVLVSAVVAVVAVALRSRSRGKSHSTQ